MVAGSSRSRSQYQASTRSSPCSESTVGRRAACGGDAGGALTSSPRQRLERLEQVLAIVLFCDLPAELASQRLVSQCLLRFPADRVGTGERLVREREVPVPDPVLVAELEAAAGVVERGLASAELGVHPRALPLAARPVLRPAVRRLH